MVAVENLSLESPAFGLRRELTAHSTGNGGPDGPAIPGSRFDLWRKRIRFRRHLARLSTIDPRLIEDIGLTLQEAESEIERPLWRL